MGDQIAVPPENSFGADQQPYGPQHVAGERVQQRREDCPVGGMNPRRLGRSARVIVNVELPALALLGSGIDQVSHVS